MFFRFFIVIQKEVADFFDNLLFFSLIAPFMFAADVQRFQQFEQPDADRDRVHGNIHRRAGGDLLK